MAALSCSKTHHLSFVLLRIRKLFVNVIQSVSRKEVFGYKVGSDEAVRR